MIERAPNQEKNEEAIEENRPFITREELESENIQLRQKLDRLKRELQVKKERFRKEKKDAEWREKALYKVIYGGQKKETTHLQLKEMLESLQKELQTEKEMRLYMITNERVLQEAMLNLKAMMEKNEQKKCDEEKKKQQKKAKRKSLWKRLTAVFRC